MRLNSAQKLPLLIAAMTALAAPHTVGMLRASGSPQTSQGGTQSMQAGRIPGEAVEARPRTSPVRFEVASVKLNNGTVGRGNLAIDGMRLTWRQASVKRLICEAFKMQYPQVLGAPGWADTEQYDVEAKAEKPSTRDEFREMLKNLLADRFRLAVRTRTKALPVYVLMVAKGGLQTQRSPSTRTEQAGTARSRE